VSNGQWILVVAGLCAGLCSGHWAARICSGRPLQRVIPLRCPVLTAHCSLPPERDKSVTGYTQTRSRPSIPSCSGKSQLGEARSAYSCSP